MKHFATTVALAVVALSAGLPGVSIAGDTASVATPCTAPASMDHLQRRIVAKASQGVDSLRDFIYITRGIYALDMNETVAWLDAQRRCVAVADAGDDGR
ncbi:MAG TPA: hypothetical protein VFF72_10790 [Caldimonas sp.]|nr:hypothetical protein [Caldimonas sp.]